MKHFHLFFIRKPSAALISNGHSNSSDEVDHGALKDVLRRDLKDRVKEPTLRPVPSSEAKPQFYFGQVTSTEPIVNGGGGGGNKQTAIDKVKKNQVSSGRLHREAQKKPEP